MIPIVVTLSVSLLTVEFLYSLITHKREVLAAIFVFIYALFMYLKKYVAESVYPSRKDGRVEPRRTSLTALCNLAMNICVVVITRLIFDMFMVARVKIHMVWWQYIDLFAIGITFLVSFLVNK